MKNTIRKNPLLASFEEKGNNTTSHIEDSSFCPVCNNKMIILESNAIPSYVCLEHRINLPIKDEQ